MLTLPLTGVAQVILFRSHFMLCLVSRHELLQGKPLAEAKVYKVLSPLPQQQSVFAAEVFTNWLLLR